MVKQIISMTRPEEDELDALKYVDQMCHNTPGDTTLSSLWT